MRVIKNKLEIMSFISQNTKQLEHQDKHFQPHVVFFDLGNTLIYFDGNWSEVMEKSTKSLWNSLQESGITLLFDKFSKDFSLRMHNYYHQRIVDLVEQTSARILGECLAYFGFDKIQNQIIQKALQAMYLESQKYWFLETDTIETLSWIRQQGYKLGLISNASDKADVLTLLEQFNLTHYFEHLIISAEFGLRKPHPDIFHEGLRLFNAQPENCFMVGDRLDMDILGANRVGIPSIWISRRAFEQENTVHDEAKPVFSIKNLDDLKQIL